MDKKTRTAFFWTRILSTPFFVLFTLLPFILYRDVGASLFQVTLFMIMKPVFSLIAPYWSVTIYKRPDRLVANLAIANVLKFLPFLFIPLFDSVFYFSFASVVYLILGKGVIPTWMELIKLNIPDHSRTKVFAFGQAFDYLGIAFFPLTFGWFLDSYAESWRWLFLITAFLGIFSTLFLLRIPKRVIREIPPPPKLKESLLHPWKKSWELLQERPDFARFQLGFMFGGAGLMILQPSLPVFFTDRLQLSYQEMLIALSFCKGVGYAITTPFWVRLFEKVDIFRFSNFVLLLCALFPIILLFAEFHLWMLWTAYLAYGMMQAGSELSWHLSGPTFSQENDSSIFSQTNVLSVGMRGAVMPFIGYTLCQSFGAPTTLIVASLFCLIATTQMVNRLTLNVSRS